MQLCTPVGRHKMLSWLDVAELQRAARHYTHGAGSDNGLYSPSVKGLKAARDCMHRAGSDHALFSGVLQSHQEWKPSTSILYMHTYKRGVHT
eukprot:scaffold192853_cov18-Tisochrysis_lutea.AAC.1